MIEGQEEDAEQPRRAVHQGGDGGPQALLGVTQHAVGGPVWNGDGRSVKLLPGKTELRCGGAAGSLTHEAAVEHPGSHQREREQEEDVVVVVPGTWKTTAAFDYAPPPVCWWKNMQSSWYRCSR